MARLKITQPCDRCGNPFHPWPKRKEQERRQFCSTACREIPELERFWLLVDKTPGFGPNGDCWEWTGNRDKDGYGMFYRSKSRTTTRAHRYSWELVNGPIPKGLCGCHHCDYPPCVRPEHIFPGTNADNTADKIAKGRGQFGERHGMAKLSESNVIAIRFRYKTQTITQTALALEYGVDQTMISMIVNHRSWRHLT